MSILVRLVCLVSFKSGLLFFLAGVGGGGGWGSSGVLFMYSDVRSTETISFSVSVKDLFGWVCGGNVFF